MIELRHVTKIYSGSHKAVDNINLTIPTGEIIGFIGPNGAGKTTTIKMISGILSPDEGEILINGKNIVTQPLEAKKEFGIVPDNADIFLRLKGIEYLNFMADMYEVDNATRQQRIQELSETFEMQNALNDKILSYSHGMRQKIVIMGVLISDPNVWILDEPMTGLDPQSSYSLKQRMKDHAAKGNTVFFSTHVLEVAEKLCDKVAIINKGSILFFGTLEELKAHKIENVLALRGDIPQDGKTPEVYHYASELIREIKEAGDFCIGAACYPEGHPESSNKSVDMDYLKQKVDAGCDFVTTQMFFDNSLLYSYLYRIREKGITIPVIAGIMPVTSGSQLKRIAQMSGSYMPARFLSLVDKYGDNPAAMKQAGIAYATDQIIDLLANGIKGIHVYTMNKPDVAAQIQSNISELLK